MQYTTENVNDVSQFSLIHGRNLANVRALVASGNVADDESVSFVRNTSVLYD